MNVVTYKQDKATVYRVLLVLLIFCQMQLLGQENAIKTTGIRTEGVTTIGQVSSLPLQIVLYRLSIWTV